MYLDHVEGEFVWLHWFGVGLGRVVRHSVKES